MKELLIIAISSAIVNNVVFSQFLGICPFLGVSKKLDTATSMSAAVIVVMVIATAVTWPIQTFILDRFGIGYLYRSLGVYLPLITTNCAVLGVALNNVDKYDYNILQGTVNGFATAVGFAIALILMAGIREKIEYNDIPKPFKGTAIVLIISGLMAIAFIGFSGII